jgi:penicillin-binding protein 1A
MRWLRVLPVAFLLGLLSLVAAFFGFVTAAAQNIADLSQVESMARNPAQMGFIYARDPSDARCWHGDPFKNGCRWERIATLRSDESRILLSPAQISPQMKDAIVAIEDRRFFQHKGFDPQGIARALIKRVLLGAQEGGSTITQQLVKNTYLGSEQTLKRKLQEVVLAYQLERKWDSKQRILAAYLNTIYFGHGCYGVESAARFYFDEHASQLDAAQAALLAAVPKSPLEFDPMAHPQAALDRRNLVIDDMVTQGYLTANAGAAAKQAPLMPNVKHSLTFGGTKVPYFVEYVTSLLQNRYGDGTFTSGMKVYTSINLREQEIAEKTIKRHLQGVGPDASLVSIQPGTGQVMAMVGGDNFAQEPFNTATQGHRQPGSAFKPFVLAAALRKGIQPATQFRSGKVLLPVDTNHWIYVKNDTPNYLGWIKLPEAMTVSDNTVYMQLTATVHPQAVVDAAHAMGIVSPLDPNLAIGLGGLRVGVTPLEMAHAYATIANEGTLVGGSILFHTPDAGYRSANQDPISILKVQFPDGHADLNRPSLSRALAPVDAESMLDTMRGVVGSRDGTGYAAALPGRTVIGKTGTTSDYKDAWFVGATPQRVASVWVGYVRPARSMRHEYHGRPVFGGTYPAEIWKDFMSRVLAGQPSEGWPSSPGRAAREVVVDTRKDPWTFGQVGCVGVRPLVVSYADVPKTSEQHCVRNLTMVPDLSGQTSRKAARLAEGQGLLFQQELIPAKPGQPIGVVVDQVPDPGVSVPFHDPVRVFIPVRVPLVVVPYVTGTRSSPILLGDAIAQLQTAGFKVAIEDQDPRTGFPPLAVVGQDTDPGEAAAAGTLVTLAVTGNANATRVPRLAGLTLGQVRARLSALGLGIAIHRTGRHRAVDSDRAVSADIPPGTYVAPGTVIAVGVASH